MLLNITNKILGFVVWVPIVFLSFVLAVNTFSYFSFDTSSGFLSEKSTALKDDLWIASFYIHITFGIPCLILPITQFSKYILKKHKNIHVKMGNIYSYSTLFIVAPTGMYMSLYAKEGFWSGLGFFVTGVVLSLFTYWGVIAMRKGKLKKHIEWMTRSFAVTTSALTFRILHLYFNSIGLDYHYNYLMSLWMSLIINILLAEVALYFILKRFKISNHKIRKS